jgi:YD repeat-containing protein
MQFRFVCSLLLITFLSLAPASAQNKWDLNTEHLLGPVHTIQTELAEIRLVDGKQVETGRRPHQKVVYDRVGNEIERINFNQDGSIENRTVQIIDAQGRIAGWEGYEPQTGGTDLRLTGSSEWIYDEKGRRIETRGYTNGVLTYQTTATFNTAGLLVKETRITDGGAWTETKKYEYDSNGHLSRTVVDTNGTIQTIEETHDKSGNLTSYSSPDSQGDSKAKYVYDAQGREIERNAENSISKFKRITSYDQRGRVSKRVTYLEYKQPNISVSHAPEPGTVEFRYNNNDQVIEESAYSPEGALVRKQVSEYDTAGRLRSQTFTRGDDISKATYEYDKLGNRVSRVTTSSREPGNLVGFVEYRVISYYDQK